MSRVVLITGGARGIGRGIAEAFLRAGHRVMIADLADSSAWNYDLADRSNMDDAVAQLGNLGEIAAVPVDVTNSESCRHAVEKTRTQFGQLDVLVNNAGVVASGPISQFDEADWDRIFDVSGKGIYLMTQSALTLLSESNDAAVVNTASIAGKKGSAGLSAYCGSKFAAVGITQSLALEFAPMGIRVNALCPGIVGTAMWHDHLMAGQGEGQFRERMKAVIPLGRPQETSDMGDAAVYLATAQNVTGVALTVAGGMEMN